VLVVKDTIMIIDGELDHLESALTLKYYRRSYQAGEKNVSGA
jgi:hypothetical protein